MRVDVLDLENLDANDCGTRFSDSIMFQFYLADCRL